MPTDCISSRSLHYCELSLRLRSRCEEFELLLAMSSVLFAEQSHGIVAGSVVSPFDLYRLVVPFFFVIARHAVGVETVDI